MKKFIKVIGYTALGFIALGIAVSMLGGGNDSDVVETTAKPQQEAPKEEKVETISQENFDKIVQGDSLTGEGGMTIEEVKAVLGEADSESQSQSGDMKMEMLTWTSLKFETISVTFINGKVSAKSYLK